MARQTPPPADFDKHERLIWSAAQHQLRLQQTWSKTDVPLLTFYVRNVRLAQRAREAAGRMPLTRSSQTSQPIAHVELTIAEKAEANALKYANALLLTPEARKKHGITAPAAATSELDALLG